MSRMELCLCRSAMHTVDHSTAVPQFSNDYSIMGHIWLQSGGAVVVETEKGDKRSQIAMLH